DRSAANFAHAGQAKISLGIWHAAVPLEASRRDVPARLWRARFCGHAERLDIPDSVSAHFPRDGFDFDLHAALDVTRSSATTLGVFFHESEAGAFLLRAVSRGRLERRLFRVFSRAQGALALALVAVPATLLLSPGDVLRDDQVGGDGGQRRRGWLGQAGKKSHGRSAAVKC